MSVSLVQSQGFQTNGSGPVTRTLNSVAAGDLLVSCFIVATGGSWSGITVNDNNSNTYTIIEGVSESGQPMGIAYATNVNAGNTTVTVGGPHVFTQADFMEFSSGITGAPLALDVVLASAAGTGTAISSGAATTANNIELLIGTCQNASGTISVGSGYTIVNSVVNQQIVEYQVTSSSGSYAATATGGSSVAWGAVGAAFLILPLPIYNTIAGRFNTAGSLVGGLLVPIWTSTNFTPVTVHANTTSDQNLMSIIIPANTLNIVGRNLHYATKGIYSTPISSTAMLEFKVMLGTLTLIDIVTTANAGSITNNSFLLEGNIIVTVAGTSATFESSGILTIDLGATTATACSVFADTNDAVSSTLDITANETLQITVAFSAGSTSNSATQRQLILNTVN